MIPPRSLKPAFWWVLLRRGSRFIILLKEYPIKFYPTFDLENVKKKRRRRLRR
jgi:hypothetical protein